MEGQVKNLIDQNLKELNLVVDSVVLEKENGNLYLRICLDSNDIIDLDKIIKATKLIDSIISDADLIKEAYILDVYGKSKGSDFNEC